MTDRSRAVDATSLRDRWYAEGWYSSTTCIDVLHSAAVEHAGTPVVFVADGAEITASISELNRTARALAAGMQSAGVRAGDAVAVQLPNCIECAITYQAVLLCGAVLVPIVHIYGPTEVSFILAQSGAKMMVMPARHRSTSFIERVAEYSALPALDNVVGVGSPGRGDHLRWAELAASGAEYSAPEVLSDDVCALLYTSGTVSVPKGVQHSHNSLLAEQKTLPFLLARDPDDVQLVTFPPGHIAGLNSVLRPMVTGSRCVYLDQWDANVAADLIERFSVTSTSGAPFHLDGLLRLEGVSAKLTNLRQFLTGAAPVTDELGRRAAAAGVNAYRCYGLTEHPTVTGARPDDRPEVRMGTDGAPMPGCAVRIVAADGAECPTGVDGEVTVQGPDQFVGYQDPDLNREAFTADGWFRSGDLGHLDQNGRLTITDRIKDVIIRGGETISSAEIEDVIQSHPSVVECAVVAAPDARYGEVVAAVVVLDSGAELDIESLRRHFAGAGLAKQKTPEQLVVVDSLPRTALGKVRKADLRRMQFY